jgi:CheY-like chemotaxis protein
MASGTVLVIDEQSEANATQALLQEAAYRVLTVGTGEQALDALESGMGLAAVLASLVMPDGGSGATFVANVRICYPSTAFVVTTPSPERVVDATIPVLAKPFSARVLIGTIERLCAETRRTLECLETTFKWNQEARQQLAGARASLLRNIRSSQERRAERLRADLRSATRPAPTVLVAEDNPVLRYAICRFLTGSGFHILSAGTGADALEVSRDFQGRIDLVLTDFHMPGGGGLELAGALASERPEAKVLIMSASELRMQHRTLRKPFELEDLLIEIASVLAAR